MPSKLPPALGGLGTICNSQIPAAETAMLSNVDQDGCVLQLLFNYKRDQHSDIAFKLMPNLWLRILFGRQNYKSSA